MRRKNADVASPGSPTVRKEALNRRRSSDLLYLTNPNVRKGAAGGDKEEGSNFEVYTQTYESHHGFRCCAVPQVATRVLLPPPSPASLYALTSPHAELLTLRCAPAGSNSATRSTRK